MPGSEFGPLAARESSDDMAIFRQLFTPENRHENGGEDEWRWDRRSGLCPSLVEFCGEYCSVRFHPTIAYGTAAIRANTQLDGNTIAYWTVHASKIYGSSMMFGIGTDQALLSTPFVWTDLLGGFITSGQNPKQNRNEWQSCGLSHKGVFFAGGSPTIFCAPFPEGAEVEVGVIFDGPRRRLGFVRDGQWLGWAPTKLTLKDGHGKDILFYPMVASTAQRSQFKLVRQMHWKMRAPKQLLHICKDSIATAIMAEFAKMPNTKKMMENYQSPSMTKVANANEEEDATLLLLLLRRRIDELGLPRIWSDTIFVECVQRQTTNGINRDATDSQKEQQTENGENGNGIGAVPRAKAANDSPRPSRRFLLKSLKHQMGRSSAKRPRPPLRRTTSIEMAQPPTSPF